MVGIVGNGEAAVIAATAMGDEDGDDISAIGMIEASVLTASEGVASFTGIVIFFISIESVLSNS